MDAHSALGSLTGPALLAALIASGAARSLNRRRVVTIYPQRVRSAILLNMATTAVPILAATLAPDTAAKVTDHFGALHFAPVSARRVSCSSGLSAAGTRGHGMRRHLIGWFLATFLSAALIGALSAGHNPLGWAKDVWYDVTGGPEQVEVDRATGQPLDSDAAGFPPQGSVDGHVNRSWATTWRDGGP